MLVGGIGEGKHVENHLFGYLLKSSKVLNFKVLEQSLGEKPRSSGVIVVWGYVRATSLCLGLNLPMKRVGN